MKLRLHPRSPLLLLLAAASLSACDPITLGLGLGGGYVASREINKSKEKQERAVDRRVEREQQYYQEQDRSRMEASDQQIATQMVFGMLGGGLTNVMNVTPDVRGGVVTLYGTVPSSTVADRAVDIARQTPGVREVVSRLNIMEMHITPTGKAWGHVPRAPRQPQEQQGGGQPMQAPQGQMPQGQMQQQAPQITQPLGTERPPVVSYPEHQGSFAPIVKGDAPPLQVNAPPVNSSVPQGMPPQGSAVPREPIMPLPPVPEAPQGQYVPQPGNPPRAEPMPEPPMRREYQEPEGTVPRTLPGMQNKQ